MTLRSQSYVDILHESKHVALRHAQVWMEVVKFLEKQIAEEHTRTVDLDGLDLDLGGTSVYTGTRQGRDLSRDRK